MDIYISYPTVSFKLKSAHWLLRKKEKTLVSCPRIIPIPYPTITPNPNPNPNTEP